MVLLIVGCYLLCSVIACFMYYRGSMNEFGWGEKILTRDEIVPMFMFVANAVFGPLAIIALLCVCGRQIFKTKKQALRDYKP